jgi:micrococcal nuclease
MERKPLFFVILTFLIFIPFISHANAQTYKVKRVVDGDTLFLANGEYVRLIGVDTPETKHPEKPVEYFGEEACSFTKKLAEGKEARLEYDQTRRDRYGRILAYVYLLDGTLLNAEIIKQGYGFDYTKYPFKYMGEFGKYEGG